MTFIKGLSQSDVHLHDLSCIIVIFFSIEFLEDLPIVCPINSCTSSLLRSKTEGQSITNYQLLETKAISYLLISEYKKGNYLKTDNCYPPLSPN